MLIDLLGQLGQINSSSSWGDMRPCSSALDRTHGGLMHTETRGRDHLRFATSQRVDFRSLPRRHLCPSGILTSQLAAPDNAIPHVVRIRTEV
jgi:hypothetical protein